MSILDTFNPVAKIIVEVAGATTFCLAIYCLAQCLITRIRKDWQNPSQHKDIFAVGSVAALIIVILVIGVCSFVADILETIQGLP